jgi:TolA-binding protein
MKYKSILLIPFLIVLFSCKTQEDIQRDKTVDNLNEQFAQTQKSTATTSGRFQNLEEQVAKMSGVVEEVNHARIVDQKEMTSLKDRLAIAEEVNKRQNEFIKDLSDKVQEQSKYIEQVIKSLNGLAEKPKEKVVERDAPLAGDDITLKNGMDKYKAKDYASSKAILEKVLENKKLKKKDKAQAMLTVGLIEYRNKNFEEAKIYFSRIFTEMPDSSYAPSALYNLAKTFMELKSKDEAKLTIDELVSRFPKSKEAAKAQKLK